MLGASSDSRALHGCLVVPNYAVAVFGQRSEVERKLRDSDDTVFCGGINNGFARFNDDSDEAVQGVRCCRMGFF
jgi:hypothetical protein